MADLVDYALTTVADVKENLGLASSDHSKDNLITRKINQVTDLIQKYCGRQFKLQQYTEDKDGSQIDTMVLDQRPVVIDDDHAFGVQRRDTSLNESNFETVDSNLAFVDLNSGVVELNYNALGHWNRYRYTYWAGYATIPNDLAEAAATIAAYFVNNPAGTDVGMLMRKEGQREVRYASAGLSFKTLIEQLGVDGVLDSYSNQPVLTDS